MGGRRHRVRLRTCAGKKSQVDYRSLGDRMVRVLVCPVLP